VESDGPGFAGIEVDAVKADQRADRKLDALGNKQRSAQIDLWHFVRSHGSGVLYGEVDIKTAIGGCFDNEAGVVEGGVAESVAEGEQRIDALLVEPAVADVDAFE
jgi:hypothetical protein